MVLRRRSNPWPALADLFAALLVATFAGLIILDVVGQQEDPGAHRADLEDRVEQLSEALEASEQRFGTLEAAHQKALARLDKLEANAEICQERLGFFEEQVRNKGFDRPPCMLSEGRPSPLVEVTVLSGGEIMVRRLDPGRYEEAVSLMPGYANLDVSEPIRPEQLAGIADPILSWAREPENAFGFECVFYARVEIQTQSARDLAKALSYVNEFFYTFDQPDIRAVYRRNEN